MRRSFSTRLTRAASALVAAMLVAGSIADGAEAGPRATAVSAGGDHACVLLADQTVRCWGQNDHGQLGTGRKTRPKRTPVAVRGVTGATAVSAGGRTSCALILGGTVQCWGTNDDGQLGDGTRTDRFTPVTVSGLTDAIAVSTGVQHSCAVLADHAVECWGANDRGQLGNGTRTPSLTPEVVPGLTNATAVTTGDLRSCALLADGTAECWGWSGMLGPIEQAGDHLTPVAVAGLSGAVTIGTSDRSCALLVRGVVECWDSLRRPSRVPGFVGVKGFAFSADGLQGDHQCALLSTGDVKCSGVSYWGELGNGFSCRFISGGGDGVQCPRSQKPPTGPVTVSGLHDATMISASSLYTCAVRSGGGVKCWGDMFSLHVIHSKPVSVPGLG